MILEFIREESLINYSTSQLPGKCFLFHLIISCLILILILKQFKECLFSALICSRYIYTQFITIAQ